jgi:tetratricopeptide (TPR) repeat protein
MLALICAATAVQADEYQDVNQLMVAGRFNEAVAKADAFLMSKPGDSQMRFLKGVVQRNAGKLPEAIAIFTKLTEDFPTLSEPYNNLAVIYAGQNQLDKAKTALEMAIRVNPGFATAHENLGDLYLRLASQTYARALELDSANTVIPGKMSIIREAYKLTAKAPSPVAGRPTALAPGAPAKLAPSPAAVAKPALVPAAANKSKNEVEIAVMAWAKAWSSQDAPAYLAAYSKNFTPPDAKSHAAWATERKARLLKKGGFTVSLDSLNIKVTGTQAVATFRQNYQSSTAKVVTKKTLALSKVDDKWLIVKESKGK